MQEGVVDRWMREWTIKDRRRILSINIIVVVDDGSICNNNKPLQRVQPRDSYVIKRCVVL
jgi:hypothetical protein